MAVIVNGMNAVTTVVMVMPVAAAVLVAAAAAAAATVEIVEGVITMTVARVVTTRYLKPHILRSLPY
jgi:hypothetical protein